MVVDSKQIIRDLGRHFAYNGSVTVDSDGLISCAGSVQMTSRMSKLPLQFKRVDENFRLESNQLKTLEGCPTYVGNQFICINNPIKDWTGAPQQVGSIVMLNSQITNLNGCPKPKHLNLVNNPLTSLEGIPPRLESLVVTYDAHLPLLRALVAKKITLYYVSTPGKYTRNEETKLCEAILNKYCGTGNAADILRCASELNEHGFEGNAEW
jgi:hypothetical protein